MKLKGIHNSCVNCLSVRHALSTCRSNSTCKYCNEAPHSLLCRSSFERPNVSNQGHSSFRDHGYFFNILIKVSLDLPLRFLQYKPHHRPRLSLARNQHPHTPTPHCLRLSTALQPLLLAIRALIIIMV